MHPRSTDWVNNCAFNMTTYRVIINGKGCAKVARTLAEAQTFVKKCFDIFETALIEDENLGSFDFSECIDLRTGNTIAIFKYNGATLLHHCDVIKHSFDSDILKESKIMQSRYASTMRI